MDTRLLAFRKLIKFFMQGDTNALVKQYPDVFCLFLCQLVYFSTPFIIKNMRNLGCDNIMVVDYDGPMALCATLNGVNYVAIKGLSGRNKKEWPIILNFIAKQFHAIKAHRGFSLATSKLVPHVQSFIEQYPHPVILTGHSMGGAIATLTSLAVDGCKVVTFGAPKMVRAGFSHRFLSKEMTHYRISNDFVTGLPPFVGERPGKVITFIKTLNFFRFWDNHKLYAYSTLLLPELDTSPLDYAIPSLRDD